MSPSESDTIAMILECLRSPALRESVTFRRFLRLLQTISEKQAAGEDISGETDELIALRPAIDEEMRMIEQGGRPS